MTHPSKTTSPTEPAKPCRPCDPFVSVAEITDEGGSRFAVMLTFPTDNEMNVSYVLGSPVNIAQQIMTNYFAARVAANRREPDFAELHVGVNEVLRDLEEGSR